MRFLALALAAVLFLFGSQAHASETDPKEEVPEDEGTHFVGPLATTLGAAGVGGGVAMLALADSQGVTIGGSLIGAFGTGTMMAGVASWMMADLTEEESEDKVRQGGVALTTVGVGAMGFGSLMLVSSFSDGSDVNDTTRVAGIAAAGAGGAGLLTGLIMYAVGGAPPDEDAKKASWNIEAGPGTIAFTSRF